MKQTSHKLSLSKALLFECDIQEPMRRLSKRFPQVLNTALQLAQLSTNIKIPLISTQHEPPVYGYTATELSQYYDSHKSHLLFRYTKTQLFSMLELPVLYHMHLYPQRTQCILYGCLTEVCVKYTCFDLLERGYQVHLVSDGICSIHQQEREVAMEQMRDAGAMVTTCESIVNIIKRDQ
ncbi:hypothetical protein FGO68_gene12420 [Halteria grandinella]|uniref:Isochorismatase-like domain-containing protein n=1 Tax=Halteria grandinella TaxID=5974 RepID=A0A8J8NCJ7_HALGN|nr:hypothetical protein FGO68_gene12420 [Halteria grandinella]